MISSGYLIYTNRKKKPVTR